MKLPVTILLLFSLASLAAQKPQEYVVYFPFNKYYISNAAAQTLDKAIKDCDGKIVDSVKIYAYCDAIGGLLANDTLAINRTQAVKKYLLDRRIGGSNFKEIKGFGKRMPVNDNSNDSLRALNRRAEILIYARAMEGGAKTAGGSVSASGIRVMLENTKAGEKFSLRNLNFYGGQHILLPSSQPILDSLATVLKQYPGINIEIQGYVCCVNVGTEGYDQDTQKWELSSTRARAIYNSLIMRGVDAHRMQHHGYGNRPLVKEMNEADRVTNRRVEIKILSK
jgi:outer membrane protein OmpA-like peptidoglycan-associated protein